MGGYSDNREQNYEIKYLRKALLRVDDRIRVPESISAQSLRHLLDDVEQPMPRGSAGRTRPRWLSLQSGIAYAAAFLLIVALFYSTRMYSPDMITGGFPVSTSQAQTAPDVTVSDIVSVAENAHAPAQEASAQASGENDLLISGSQAEGSKTAPVNSSAPESTSDLPAVGGSGMASLLLEDGQISYYWRLNDKTDPDKAGFPCTLEIIDSSNLRIEAQIDYENIKGIHKLFSINDRLVVIGIADSPEPCSIIYVYDASDPLNPVQISEQIQPGTIVDANAYKDIVHLVSVSNDAFGDIEDLPNHSDAQLYCIIGALSPAEPKSYTKSFAGLREDSSVQLHNLNAYIRYAGDDGSGGTKEYIAQINLDRLDMELGTVS